MEAENFIHLMVAQQSRFPQYIQVVSQQTGHKSPGPLSVSM